MKPNRRVKKSESPTKLVLEEIIGLTTKNANGLASSESTSLSAYIAGCAVVLHDADSGQQSHLLASHRTPKPLSCVAMSRDGRFVAAGESGNQPAVLVWDRLSRSFLSELSGHVYGVECIAFSPDGERLVSVGGYINIWDWKNGMLVAKLKASSSSSAITSVSFSSNGKFIITAGKKHLKFWTVGSTPKKSTRLNRVAEGALTLQGKPVNLGPHKGSSFVCVTSSANVESIGTTMFLIYALTVEGVLCAIDNGLSVVKSAELKVGKGLGLSASSKLIACACCNGIVKLFTSETLSYAGTLLYSRPKNFDEPSDELCQTEVAGDDSIASSPDAVACQFSASEKLVVIYADHTLYIWDVLDVNKATRCWMLVSHSACIWDIKNLCCENMHDPSLVCVARGCLGGVSFATCSADGTIRLWDLESQPQLVGDDSEDHALNAEPLSTSCLVSTGIFERDTLGMGVSNQGLRSMAVSSDGKYLAAGDSEGNLHIYNLSTSDYTCIQDAHQAEILSLSFSASHEEHVNSQKVDDGNYLLVSGARDRVIHIYDVKRNFDLLASVDDHSAAVTCVKLDREGCKAISCSADRSLVFRDVFVSDSGCKIFRRHHQMASNGTVYDMAVDPKMEFVVTVGQDKKINTFDVASGKPVRSFKQDKDFGDPIKVVMDPSCTYLVCSYSNKSICIYDSMSGEILTQAMGHGEVVTGVVFLPDCKHLVSVAGDGCIFVWKLPPRMTCRILQRMKEISVPLSPRKLSLPVTFTQVMLHEKDTLQFTVNPEDEQETGCERVAQKRTPNFRFSISRLPKWAQCRLADSGSFQTNPISSPCQDQEQVQLKIVSPLTSNGRESDHPCLEVQSPPPSLGTCGTNSCLSSSPSDSTRTSTYRSEPMSCKSLSQFAMDKRWLSVYTVCHILNSPELQRTMDLNMLVPSTTSVKDEVPMAGAREAGTSEPQSTSSNCDFVSREHNHQLASQIMNASEQQIADQISEQYSFRSENQSQEAAIAEESEIFKQHFGNLSTATKIEGCKSSVRRSYSTRYVVRRDNPAFSQKLFATPLRDSGRKTSKDIGDVGFHIDSENPLGGRGPRERVSVYREALLKLDAATDDALHLFSNGYEAEFYEGASDLLSSITEKINEVAKLVHRGK